jgi:hypothetical protein
VSWKSASLLSALLCASAVLNGCGVDSVDHSITGALALRGMVHGGQQPVTGSVIQLYTVGSGGNGSAATAMLTLPVTSQADGSFDITGDYACGKDALGVDIGSPSNQVYIVASGGNPGLAKGTDNTALVMMAALGDCANLPSASYVEINEVTTVAAVWALAPFMTSYAIVGATATSVGASSTNISGIENAFLDAGLLADTTTGLAATLPANLSIETQKLYSLADAIASCVNSDGTTGCATLFAAAKPTGGITPLDTLSAALNIVKNPGENVAAVFDAIGGRTPFTGGLKRAPNDWTMSLTVTGGGLASPTALAIDAASNVWVVGQNSPLSAFNAQGTPLSETGFGAGVLDKSQGIAIDTHGDIWVTDYNTSYIESGAVSKFLGVNSSASGPLGSVVMNGSDPGFYDHIYYPFGVSADTNGNVIIANAGNGTATVYTPAGSIYTNSDDVSGAYLGGGLDAFPNDIAFDANHGFWIPDGNYGVVHVTADGVSLSTQCCNSSWGVATDTYGNVWVANYLGGSFSEVASDGTVTIDQSTVGGLQDPQYVAVDAAQNVWFSNNGNGSVTEIAGNGGTTAAGTAISPTVGTYSRGGYGLDAGLEQPNFLAPDRSGNLWVSSEHDNRVAMFFGLATPTVTPVQPSPAAP